MRRRSFLQTSGVTSLGLTVPASTSAAGRSAGPSDRSTLASAQESYEPLGRVSVEGRRSRPRRRRRGRVPRRDDRLCDRRRERLRGTRTPRGGTCHRRRRRAGSPDPRRQSRRRDADRPGPANRGSDEFFHGFLRYDVSDPADPRAIGEPYETGTHIHNCYLDGEVLYVVANDTDENPLVVYDVGARSSRRSVAGRFSSVNPAGATSTGSHDTSTTSTSTTTSRTSLTGTPVPTCSTWATRRARVSLTRQRYRPRVPTRDGRRPGRPAGASGQRPLRRGRRDGRPPRSAGRRGRPAATSPTDRAGSISTT